MLGPVLALLVGLGVIVAGAFLLKPPPPPSLAVWEPGR